MWLEMRGDKGEVKNASRNVGRLASVEEFNFRGVAHDLSEDSTIPLVTPGAQDDMMGIEIPTNENAFAGTEFKEFI
ncbi:hypothetical protein E2C01_075975 [Portunus trituberculatus]|uniref:Uncharacterized protein n=1 Tax=Portunus trituberculatus TaxID=210409 RepID=A0A5B7IGA8_PORTR|nr:hypothetical protein [Portunus trituberculatus]